MINYYNPKKPQLIKLKAFKNKLFQLTNWKSARNLSKKKAKLKQRTTGKE